jgi:predicted DNA-binding transcriptional regulator AlpA
MPEFDATNTATWPPAMRTRHLALVLGVSEEVVRRKARNGELPRTLPLSGHPLWARSEILKLVRETR